MSDLEARNIRKALEWVACLTLGDRAGWQHHRCRDVEGIRAHWSVGKSGLDRAGLWQDRPCPFEAEDE